MEKPSKIFREIVTWASSQEDYTLDSLLPDIDHIFQTTGESSRVFEDLMSDSHVWACVQSRKSGVLSSEWRLEYQLGTEHMTEAYEILMDRIDFSSVITQILDAPLYGFSVLEVVWGWYGKYLLPISIQQKPNYWFSFDTKNRLRFMKKDHEHGVLLKPHRFLVSRHFPSYENPYGKRVLSRCFWPVVFKRASNRFWMLFMEKFGVPWLLAKVPRNTDEPRRDKILTMLKDMLQDAVAVVNDDERIESLDLHNKAATTDLFTTMLNSCNGEISKAILSQTLTTEIGSKGAYAAAHAHLDVRREVCDLDKKLVFQPIDELFRWISRYNFGTDLRPIFTFVEENDTRYELSQRDQNLRSLGVEFTETYFSRRYNLREDEFVLNGMDDTQDPSIPDETADPEKDSQNVQTVAE